MAAHCSFVSSLVVLSAGCASGMRNCFRARARPQISRRAGCTNVGIAGRSPNIACWAGARHCAERLLAVIGRFLYPRLLCGGTGTNSRWIRETPQLLCGVVSSVFIGKRSRLRFSLLAWLCLLIPFFSSFSNTTCAFSLSRLFFFSSFNRSAAYLISCGLLS